MKNTPSVAAQIFASAILDIRREDISVPVKNSQDTPLNYLDKCSKARMNSISKKHQGDNNGD